MRACKHLPFRNPRSSLFVLSAAWLPAVVALAGEVGCSSAPRADGMHADAGALLESGSPDGADDAGLSFDSGAADTGPSLDSGPGDAGSLDSGDASSPMGATMNDVTILFPLPASAADIDRLLAPSATGARGALLPSALYASVGLISGTTDLTDGGPPAPHPTFTVYGDLRVVAMRIDPCFASFDPDPLGSGCQAQIRLVFQDVRWGDGGPGVFDSAFHAFYDLDRTQLLTLARALVALRAANQDGDVLGPLAPHPIMVRQGLSGAMSQGVEALILQSAGEQNLVRVAEASIDTVELGPTGGWSLSAFDVSGAPPVATPRPIPTLSDPADGGNVFREGIGAAYYMASFGPTTSADDFTALWRFSGNYNGVPGVGPVSPSDQQAALDALVRVENPKDNSPETIDCASCHMAADTEHEVAMRLLSFDDTRSSLAFQPDGTSVAPGDMAATFSAADGPFGVNIHAFSYVGASPAISQRVVNETAAIVEYLNHLPQ
jgi:hypothetical protein